MALVKDREWKTGRYRLGQLYQFHESTIDRIADQLWRQWPASGLTVTGSGRMPTGIMMRYGLIHRLRPDVMIGNNHTDLKPGEDFQLFERTCPAIIHMAGVRVA
jgi:hypothetical protein